MVSLLTVSPNCPQRHYAPDFSHRKSPTAGSKESPHTKEFTPHISRHNLCETSRQLRKEIRQIYFTHKPKMDTLLLNLETDARDTDSVEKYLLPSYIRETR